MNDHLGGVKQLPIDFGGLPPGQVSPIVNVAPVSPIVNISKVKQLSPLRYPGGKTWLIPEIRRWLTSLQPAPAVFLEPFAGGSIASLTAVILGHVDRAVMSELDAGVAALWRSILDDADWLTRRVLEFEPSRDNVISVLEGDAASSRELAFQTLVRNRTQRGGIMANGAGLMKTGENRRGVASRWYPQTLVERITRIHLNRDRITFLHEDGFSLIRKYRSDPRAVFFVDPPYTASGKRAGRRLYNHNEIDHDGLFDLMATVEGQFLMTYDQDDRIEAMAAARGFTVNRVAMKNTHHTDMIELLITGTQVLTEEP